MNRDAALDEVILHPDLKHINFFNGRLLTGGDLQAEQSVHHAHARHLGRAVGSGVAEGLHVAEAAASPSGEVAVLVTAGLAVNRAGETLCLDCDQRVVLAQPPDPAKRDQCVFADCEGPRGNSLIPGGTGFYVLTIASASLKEGRAPVSGLGNSIATCNSRYFSEGVTFRLLPLTISGLPSNPALAQSFVAQKCLGLLNPTPWEIVTRATQALAPLARGVESMVPAGWLTSEDVPLAVVQWSNGSIGFIDEWCVRRRLTRPTALGAWRDLSSDRRAADGEALFAQFQDQLTALVGNGTASTRHVTQDFVALPPLGIIPLRGTNSPTGLDPAVFFGGLASSYSLNYYTPELDPARLPSVLSAAFQYGPVDLVANGGANNVFQIFRLIAPTAVRSVPHQALLVFARWEIPGLGYSTW